MPSPSRSDEFLSRPDDAYESQGAYASDLPMIGIREMLFALRRDWWFVVAGCLIGLVVAVSYVLIMPALYTSSARILVDRSTNRYLQTNKIVDEPVLDPAELASQIHLLSSESIVIPVVRSMDLIHDEEFVGSPNTGMSRITQKIWQALGWKTDAKNDGTAGREDVLERVAVEAFLKRLTVYREDVANVISVTFASVDPKKAARIANAMADAYVATNQINRSNSTKIASQLLQDRLMELKVQTMEADRALLSYKAAHNLTNAEKDLPIADQQVTNVGAELTKARIAVAEAKARLDRIRQSRTAAVAESEPTIDASNDTVIIKLRSQYIDLSDRMAEIIPRVEPGHEAVLKLQKRMAEVQASIRAETERLATSEYQNAKIREKEFAATMEHLLAESNTRGQAQVKMRELESTAETLRTLYGGLLQKYQEINATQTQPSGVQDATIVTRAAPPLHKNPRKGLLVLGASLGLGILLGAGAAIAKEWLADPFRTPDVLAQATGIHSVVLPIATSGPSHRGSPQDRAILAPIEEFVLDQPYSRFTETLRTVKTLINAQIDGSGGKVVGVVSSLPKEGKTTIVANLGALMIGPPGARTRGLIIDGDLHLRRLTARLAPDAREGLIEALANPSRLSELVCTRQRSGLDVLPCVLSARLPNAAELLGSPEMEQLLIAARKSYEFIIIEVAPVMSVVDLKVVERLIDRFIFVVEWGQTKRRLVLEALTEAHMIRDRLVSIVLNKADPSALRTIEAYKGARFKDYYEG
jgi:polysaccharide biosynthesis transport protein